MSPVLAQGLQALAGILVGYAGTWIAGLLQGKLYQGFSKWPAVIQQIVLAAAGFLLTMGASKLGVMLPAVGSVFQLDPATISALLGGAISRVLHVAPPPASVLPPAPPVA